METKFKLVETEKYTLAVFDKEVKEGDYIFDNYAKINLVQQVRKCDFDSSHYRNGNWKKIIAYQPKGNVTELDLPLLPDVEDDVEKLAEQFVKTNLKRSSQAAGVMIGFIEGHKAATKVYSEEDLRKAMHFGKFGEYEGIQKTQEFIQSLKQPKWFVAETEYQNLNGKWGSYYPFASSAKDSRLKTTTINNKTYLVGTYLN